MNRQVKQLFCDAISLNQKCQVKCIYVAIGWIPKKIYNTFVFTKAGRCKLLEYTTSCSYSIWGLTPLYYMAPLFRSISWENFLEAKVRQPALVFTVLFTQNMQCLPSPLYLKRATGHPGRRMYTHSELLERATKLSVIIFYIWEEDLP